MLLYFPQKILDHFPKLLLEKQHDKGKERKSIIYTDTPAEKETIQIKYEEKQTKKKIYKVNQRSLILLKNKKSKFLYVVPLYFNFILVRGKVLFSFCPFHKFYYH